MAVYILLSDGTVGEVELAPSEYLFQKNPRPIQLIPLERYTDDVVDSFNDAAFSAHQFLLRKGCWPRGSGYAFAYRIIDQSGNGLAPKMHGKSGGLGFSLALIIHILKVCTDDLTVGATGEISPITGIVEPVNFLPEKLHGGIKCLPCGSRIYYPRANELEERGLESLQAEAVGKDIVFKVVSTVDEAAEDFSPKNRWRLKKLAVPFLTLLSVYFLYLLVSYPVALYLLEAGKYEGAEYHLAVGTRLFPWHKRLAGLHQDLKQPFEVRVLLRYSLQIGEEGQYSVSKIPRGWTLGSSDSYTFQVTPSSQVYLYVFEFDSVVEVRILFPSSLCSTINPLAPRKTYPFPDKGISLPPRGYQGVMQTDFVASRWRCKDLEKAPYAGEGKRALRVRRSDLELMILKRDRSGLGARLERAVFLQR